MREVTITWSSIEGDSVDVFLIDVGDPGSCFDPGPNRIAIAAAIDEFYRQTCRLAAIQNISVRETACKVLKP